MASVEEDPDDRDQRDKALSRAMRDARVAQNAKDRRAKADSGPIELPAPSNDADMRRLRVRRDLIRRNDPSGLERLVGARDIVSVNFLERGLRAARAVCRIKTLNALGGQADYATGFLVAPSLLVTNNHVLPDPETANRSLAEFELELDVNFVDRRGRIFPFAPQEAFFTSAELDFTIVAISPMAHDGTPITDFGVLRLIPESGKGIPGEHVSIIQHPAGGTKQVVLRKNEIIALDDAAFAGQRNEFLHYTADTERGSSGSPVFNDQWDLVAVHHKAIAARDESGECLTKNGKTWTMADGLEAKQWIGNEGVRVSAIFKLLRRAASLDTDAAKIMAMLAYEPSSARRPREIGEDEGPKKWRTLPNVPDAVAFEAARFADPAFRDSLGYDPDFLGSELKVALPKTSPAFKGALATNKEPRSAREVDKHLFDYTHFSLAMHLERRVAVWTAVNIAGDELKSSKAEPGWRRDRRLPADQQTLAEVYGKVPGKTLQIDRGHLVRRLDPVWGSQEVADRAAADTFHYTNAAPQEHVYNSETWGDLEDFVLARADERDHKATVMTGPILRPDDSFYGEGLRGGPWQIPWSFWKIAVFRRADGTPSVTGFIVEQTPTLSPLFEASRYNPYSVDEARVFQRPIRLIEDLTGLDFGRLRTMDRMGDVETTSSESARPIRSGDDIIF